MEAENSSHGVEKKGDPYSKLVMGQVVSIQLPFPKGPTVPGTLLDTREEFWRLTCLVFSLCYN